MSRPGPTVLWTPLCDRLGCRYPLLASDISDERQARAIAEAGAMAWLPPTHPALPGIAHGWGIDRPRSQPVDATRPLLLAQPFDAAQVQALRGRDRRQLLQGVMTLLQAQQAQLAGATALLVPAPLTPEVLAVVGLPVVAVLPAAELHAAHAWLAAGAQGLALPAAAVADGTWVADQVQAIVRAGERAVPGEPLSSPACYLAELGRGEAMRERRLALLAGLRELLQAARESSLTAVALCARPEWTGPAMAVRAALLDACGHLISAFTALDLPVPFPAPARPPTSAPDLDALARELSRMQQALLSLTPLLEAGDAAAAAQALQGDLQRAAAWLPPGIR